MTYWTELVRGSYVHRGVVVPVSTLPEHISAVQKTQEPLFESYFRFGPDIQAWATTHHTVKGYPGIRYLDRIVFDIDGDLEAATRVVQRLHKEFQIPMEWIVPYFSGTGYHIAIPEVFGFTPSPNLPSIVKATLTTLFPEADDIYDAPRLIRVANTKNAKSGLFKIPLTMLQFDNMTEESIRKLAEQPSQGDIAVPTGVPTHLEKYIVQAKTVTKSLPENPVHRVTCVQHMYEEGPRKGERHNKMLRMASSYRRSGITQSGVRALLAGWDTDAEVEKVITDVFRVPLQYGCHDPIMAAYCDPKCMFYSNKDYVMNVKSAKDMEREFIRITRTDFSTIAFDMKELYPEADSYRVFPGELVVVIGDTGVNKTAWVQNLCVPLTRMRILFLSLEVHAYLLYRRFIQIAHGMTKAQVEAHYRQENNTLSTAIQHIHVVTSSPLLNDIERLVREVSPNIMVVDTTDGIRVPGMKDPSIAAGEVGIRLKEIAQDLGIIVIGVHHISKGALKTWKGDEKPLDVHSGKGSSSVEQKADKVIGIEGDRTGIIRKITSLKARDEGRFSVHLSLQRDTFRMPTLNQLRRGV